MSRAFTLVEVIASMAIVGVLALTIASVLRPAIDNYLSATVRAELLNTGSAALERLITSVRDIPLRAGVTPAEPAIATITAGSITWDGNNGVSLSGANLQLTVAGVATTMVSNVTDFQVEAFDESGNALGSSLSGNACDLVRWLRFTLTLSRDGVSETLRTVVFLRCMMKGAKP